MKKNIIKGLFFFSILFFLSSSVSFAVMGDYCQLPPFVSTTGGAPNVLFVEDTSGSMAYTAYCGNGTSSSGNNPNCNGTNGDYNYAIPYDSTQGYEGYFDPTKTYELMSDGITYREAGTSICNCTTTYACTGPNTSSTCVKNVGACANGTNYGGGNGAFGCKTTSSKPFGCCTKFSTNTTCTGDCSTKYSGNYLNWQNMSRIDLVRWSVTGGSPASCTSTNNTSAYCDPELWSQSGNNSGTKVGTVCNNTANVNGDGVASPGCILQMTNGNKVMVTFDRINGAAGGLAYQFAALQVPPRLGSMTFDTTSVNGPKVYIGDYLSSNVSSTSYPYANFIANINSSAPGGGTPTGPAMWDAFNYFAQNAPQYGGFAVESSTANPPTDRWKNPLYFCDGQGGNNCVLNSCVRNYVVLMSDGEWNYPTSKITPPTLVTSATCTTAATATSKESADPMVPAYCMHMGFVNRPSAENISTSVNGVYTVGLFMNSTYGPSALENTAMFGSFDTSSNTWPDSLTALPTTSCNSNTYSGSLCAALPASSPDWDPNGDGVPDTYFLATDALNIKQDIMNAVQDMLTRATSGTAASVLASAQGSGANLIQAVFYPTRKFTNSATGSPDVIQWISRLTNLWFYVDPFSNNSSIREDNGIITNGPNLNPMGGDKILNLLAPLTTTPGDYITQMYFDTTSTATMAHRWLDPAGNGVIGTQMPNIAFEDLGALWEAGTLLWYRNLSTSPRQIYTSIGGGLINFSTTNATTLSPYLNLATGSPTDIINWVTGVDVAGYRLRTVKVETIDTTPRVWKLGDVINSTPTIESWKELNTYFPRYGDGTYGVAGDPLATPDPSTYTNSAIYKNRGMVFSGGNDGMLHAFKLGTLDLQWVGQTATQKARMLDPNTGLACNTSLNNPTCGQELWAFIPKGALPYLQYLADPSYCHLASVDLTPYVFDASIGGPSDQPTDVRVQNSSHSPWRTILIGGMRLGGACKPYNASCSTATPNGVCAPGTVSGASVGYSEYFALDVTDPRNPSLLWEFSDPTLGFTTTGPSVVRIGDKTQNGKWFVVFGSGPTGPISTSDHQFLARSDQDLKLFILDLKTGSVLRTIDTGIATAFAGAMGGSALDLDNDYQDEVVYVPYTTKAADQTWTNGGVGRLLTMRNTNPANWQWGRLIDGIGPVTTSVGKTMDQTSGNLWISFGTGRYYFVQTNGSDDPNGQGYLFGIKDPCLLTMMNSTPTNPVVCTAGDPAVQFSSLTNVTNVSNVPTQNAADAAPFTGWYIALDPAGSYTYAANPTKPPGGPMSFLSERIITDTFAPSSGTVYFTSYKPYTDLCLLNGNTFIWAVQYDTGGPILNMKGTALMQTSTGAISQISLASAFTDMGGRRASVGLGQPPVDQGLSVQTPPLPVRRTVHVRER